MRSISTHGRPLVNTWPANRYHLGVIESAHHGHKDFRLEGRHVATLGYPDRKCGMANLTTEQERTWVHERPDVFLVRTGIGQQKAQPNGWMASTKILRCRWLFASPMRSVND